ncbi:hypothetical protein [Acidithiobacillus thiooxidans]|uniref:hypothetical protein n=1 Tax=Acidithiobacillus thiooxidans TaxID=930 RepID=UPI001D012893|nr:hypothetical protein [Acidithiobacillus thiooxidans]
MAMIHLQLSLALSYEVNATGSDFIFNSGAPVVLRSANRDQNLPWKLLGVHSARIDMGGRDVEVDDSLGPNCTWYADILMTLTAN